MTRASSRLALAAAFALLAGCVAAPTRPVVATSGSAPGVDSRSRETRTVIELRPTPTTQARNSTMSPNCTEARKSIRSERAVTTVRPAKRLAARNAVLSIQAKA